MLSLRLPFHSLRCAALALVVAVALPACAAGTTATRGSVPPVESREPLVDILHYDISVDIDHRAGQVQGFVEIRFAALPGEPVRQIELDAVELSVEGVSDDSGRDLAFSVQPGRLLITLARPLPPGEQAVVGIRYTCYPRRGLYILPPTGTGPWQIWTQGQTHETRHWIPCWDRLNDRATHELSATVDDSFVTLAAGTRTASVRPGGGRRTDTWRMDTPHAISLLTLVSGGLAQAELPGGSVPLPVLAEAPVMPWALTNLAETPEMLAIFESWTGRAYPYPKYAQACVREFVAGGMENISATTLYHETVHDPADEPQVDSFDLVAHEAAHMWFGDLVGARDWNDLWLHEGFATWGEILCLEALRGRDEGRVALLAYLRETAQATRAAARPLSWSRYATPDDMFDAHSYAGGAARLALLTEVLGPQVMQRGVARYVREHEAGLVVSADLQAALEAESGQSLARFFEQWVHGIGVPHFWLRLTDVDGRTAEEPELAVGLRIRQTQGELGWRPVFELPVTVVWSRGGVEQEARLELDQMDAIFPLPGQGRLDWVRFDAHTSVPGEFDFVQSEAMWRKQLQARDGVTRLLAAEWFAAEADVRDGLLGDWSIVGDTFEDLCQAARGDSLSAVRATALRALVDFTDGDEAHRAAPGGSREESTLEQRLVTQLKVLMKHPDARLRETAAQGLGVRGDDSVLPALTAALEDPNASVAAAALASLAERGYPGTFRLCTDLAERTSKSRLDRDILRIVADMEFEPRAVPFLLAAARTELEPGVREAALLGLGRRAELDFVIDRQLSEALYDRSHKVRAAAATALAQRGDPSARLALEARRAIEIDSLVLGALDSALQRLR
ncbi:MAG: M1 family aminopeptidase [Planctomycetota bacterium]